MASSSADRRSGNWISRFLALVLAIVAGIWLYEFTRTLPDYEEAIRMEKGTYQGQPDTPIGETDRETLRDRGRSQSF